MSLIPLEYEPEGDKDLPKWKRHVPGVPRRSGAESRDKVSLLPLVTYCNGYYYQHRQGCSRISDQCVSHHTEHWWKGKGRAEQAR